MIARHGDRDRSEEPPCPTCSGPIRETVGLVCQTCGTDYGSSAHEALVNANPSHPRRMSADSVARLHAEEVRLAEKDATIAALRAAADAAYADFAEMCESAAHHAHRADKAVAERDALRAEVEEWQQATHLAMSALTASRDVLHKASGLPDEMGDDVDVVDETVLGLRAEVERWTEKAQEAGAAYANANTKHHAELDRANRLERLADTLAEKAVDLEDQTRKAQAALARVEALAARFEKWPASPSLAVAARRIREALRGEGA